MGWRVQALQLLVCANKEINMNRFTPVVLAALLIIANGEVHRGSGRDEERGDSPSKKGLTPSTILVDLYATKVVN